MDLIQIISWGIGWLFFPRTTIVCIIGWFFWGWEPLMYLFITVSFILDILSMASTSDC